jgi:hypothetical protein
VHFECFVITLSWIRGRCAGLDDEIPIHRCALRIKNKRLYPVVNISFPLEGSASTPHPSWPSNKTPAPRRASSHLQSNSNPSPNPPNLKMQRSWSHAPVCASLIPKACKMMIVPWTSPRQQRNPRKSNDGTIHGPTYSRRWRRSGVSWLWEATMLHTGL